MKKQSERKEIKEGYALYFRESGEYIPVTKEVFEEHYKSVNVFRRKKQRHGECCCPEVRRLYCDTDCAICPYRVKAKELSLDYDSWEEDDERWIAYMADPSPSPEDSFCEKDEIRSILSRIEELMPEAIEIGKMRLKGFSAGAIGESLGVKEDTYCKRIRKLKKILKEEFPVFFENF